jgi:hypothetical protein
MGLCGWAGLRSDSRRKPQDSGLSYPDWPLKHGRGPGGLPLLNFPEISMHFREPWGWSGANPMPGRFQALWEPVSALVSGGMPYSEGVYEDINQAICFQHYWNASRTANDTVREYAASQFGTASPGRHCHSTFHKSVVDCH